jgi:hypothetical protein
MPDEHPVTPASVSSLEHPTGRSPSTPGKAPATKADRSRRDLLRLAGLGAVAAAGGTVLSSQRASAATKAASTGPNDYTQPAEGVSVQMWSVQPVTPGFEPFQAQMQSYPNTGPASGTYNHAVFMGWNASRHSGDSGTVSGRPAYLIGFEDNYYDTDGDNRYGVEWYVEYWSPDRSVKMLRPFYARVTQPAGDQTKYTVLTNLDIGNQPDGQLSVIADLINGGPVIFQVVPNAVNVNRQLNLTANLAQSGPAVQHAIVSTSGQTLLTLDSPVAPTLQFRLSGAVAWRLQTLGANGFQVANNTGRGHMILTNGPNASAAMTEFSSGVKIDGNIGFFGVTPIAQRGRPSTLADVIALLEAYGLSA